MSPTRTQVYFTEDQRRQLDERARREGKTLAAVVREAVDAYVVQPPAILRDVLDETFGAMPDLEVPDRREWDHARD